MRRPETDTAEEEPEGAGAWILLDPGAVPPRWRTRARDLSLVPLLPAEAEAVLGGGQALPEVSEEDEPLARLAARGLSGAEIAEELGLTRRTVERRLARLRERFGFSTTAQLATFLASRGFRET